MGKWGATSYIIGNIVGSGIFITPSSVLRNSTSVRSNFLLCIYFNFIYLLSQSISESTKNFVKFFILQNITISYNAFKLKADPFRWNFGIYFVIPLKLIRSTFWCYQLISNFLPCFALLAFFLLSENSADWGFTTVEITAV